MATAAESSKKPKFINAAERNKAAFLGAGEPIISTENYEVDLARAFSYYNNFAEVKDMRRWVQKYLAKDKEMLLKLNDVSDADLRQVAVLIRLVERQQPLNEKHAGMINEKLKRCCNDIKAVSALRPEPTVSAKPIITVLDRINKIASAHIADIEFELDKFILNKASDFSMKDFVASKAINGPTAKIIGKWFNKTLSELNEAIDGSDEQLVEAYGFLKSGELKKFRNLVQSIIDECVQQKVKAVRKTRKVKVKPPTEVVKRVKYMPQFVEGALTLKSEHPSKLVNSNECWLYNTKTRRMTVLKALDKDILIVKGTSIVNFDTIKSETRTLRKPEEFLKTKFTKRELSNAWKSLTTKPITANGRINGDMVIVAIFE